MIFEIILFIIFTFLIGIQIYMWCFILLGVVNTYKAKKVLGGLLQTKLRKHQEDINRGYQ